MAAPAVPIAPAPTGPLRSLRALRGDLLLSERRRRTRRASGAMGQGLLFAVTSSSAIAVLFIFYFIFRDALPFFRLEGIAEFLGSTRWFPSSSPAEFGALAIFFGSLLVTLGAIAVAIPLGVSAAVCLSDILPFSLRQAVKPVIEILAAIPSVAYGFFALVVFAPYLQASGGKILASCAWVVGVPVLGLGVAVAGDLLAGRAKAHRTIVRTLTYVVLGAAALLLLLAAGRVLGSLEITSGTNALNVAVVLGIMALPTVVSVSEDALQAAGRELREGSYALGATRAETITRVVIPAAASGIAAAVILGIMRVIGETMVVWMASGNAAQIPSPWFNLLEPIRTLTATIAGDMGEADHVTGSGRYHVLFAMAMSLLVISFACNLASEWIVQRQHKRRGK